MCQAWEFRAGSGASFEFHRGNVLLRSSLLEHLNLGPLSAHTPNNSSNTFGSANNPAEGPCLTIFPFSITTA